MRLSHVLSRTRSQNSYQSRRHVPWIASPLAEESPETTEHGQMYEYTNRQTKSNAGGRAIEFDDDRRPQSRAPIFREHHESSTVELFYDLFFVANLTTFTSNHEIKDGQTLQNYVGFFTIMWFTWLQTSLFDVRFSSDSVFNRLCKFISFGVMTGFAVVGTLYDISNVKGNADAFRAMALILMVSRLVLVIQYGVVLWYVKEYRKTFTPLLGTMGTLFVSAMIYLGTYFAFPQISKDETNTIVFHTNAFIAWYVIAVFEALGVIAISCIWRVVSFKHTHLVERIGLLTLIIMGEGIIGLTKSVSIILQKSVTFSNSDIGTVISAVLLVYFIWVLYFDQIEHDRFGTIRQQIWAILHFPLHVAILLTVEGSTALIIWNLIIEFITPLYNVWPVDSEPLQGYDSFGNIIYLNTTEDLVRFLNNTIQTFAGGFKNSTVAFDYNAQLDELLHINATFNSTEWVEQAGNIEDDLYNSLYVWMFEQFQVEAPEASSQNESEYDRVNALFNVFNTVFFYFYVAAGVFLITLAVMYWFGKKNKKPGEYASIVVRTIAGAGIIVGCLAGLNWTSSAEYVDTPWLIPTVMLSYFVVIVLDNVLVWHTNKIISRQTSNNRDEDYNVVQNRQGDGNEDIEVM